MRDGPAPPGRGPWPTQGRQTPLPFALSLLTDCKRPPLDTPPPPTRHAIATHAPGWPVIGQPQAPEQSLEDVAPFFRNEVQPLPPLPRCRPTGRRKAPLCASILLILATRTLTPGPGGSALGAHAEGGARIASMMAAHPAATMQQRLWLLLNASLPVAAALAAMPP